MPLSVLRPRERAGHSSAASVPVNDDALDPFPKNFQTLIAAAPASYGLVAVNATAITAA